MIQPFTMEERQGNRACRVQFSSNTLEECEFRLVFGHDLAASPARHPVSSPRRPRPRMWQHPHRSAADGLWVGARRDRRAGHPQQERLNHGLP